MSEFKNVTVQKEANIYFDGKVISTTITFLNGSRKTLGVMLPGEYQFNTEQKEIMEIMSGRLELMLPNKSKWENISEGVSFEVSKNSSFKLKIHNITNYCCTYIN
jgi:hypothetical protein